MKNPYEIKIIEEGALYILPTYWITDSGLEDYAEKHITFCCGDKDSDRPRWEGVLPASILRMLILYLQFKNNEIPSRETALAIIKLEQVEMLLNKRQQDRQNRGVLQTDKD